MPFDAVVLTQKFRSHLFCHIITLGMGLLGKKSRGGGLCGQVLVLLCTTTVTMSLMPRHEVTGSDEFPCDHKGTRMRGISSFCEVIHPQLVNTDDHTLHRRSTHDIKPDSPVPANLQYKFNTFDRSFHLNLSLNDRLLSSDFVVERRSAANLSESSIERAHDSHRQCVYRGNVIGHDASLVAVNVCKGLYGLISLDGDEYFIKPVNRSISSDDGAHPHVIYKSARFNRSTGESRTSPKQDGQEACSVTERKSFSQRIWGSSRKTSRHRHRRSVSRERTVETLVVVDHTMMEYYKDQDVETYILTIMNMVSSFYHHASIGNSVNIVLIRLILLEHEEEGLHITHHADNTLESFCKWQEQMNPEGDDDPMHHDNAVLITRKDLCQGINEPCSTLGLAHVSGMCHRERSCSVNEDTGLALAFTVAHEMGHNFGMQHDGSNNVCTSFDGDNPHVMSSQVIGGFTSVTWSSCSRDYITQFLDRGWGSCLEDQPTSRDYLYPLVLPGVMYSANHQCRLQYGVNATVCAMFESDLCTTLWCSVGNMCQSRLSSAVPGTGCGKDKWCISGACVEIEEPPVDISGGWGSWSEWSPCSLTCGTGVTYRQRHCDNPRPSHGGKYCVGKRKKYALCKMQDCLPGLPSVRAMQCSAYNTQENDGVFVEWIPAEIQNKPCELFCHRRDSMISEKLANRVTDGTPCTRLSRDICIDGFCQKVGCDNQVNSDAVEDRCGVCHGDGSTCETIKDKFTIESGQGYVEATVIPAGARNIRVEEIAAAGNYLAIKDTAGRYLLNGDWYIQWSGEYEAAGTTISYERIGEKERFEAQGPLSEPLHIMLLFRAQNPGVVYEYTVPRHTNETKTILQAFAWIYGDWSPCSASCGLGYQRSSVMCAERIAGVVDDGYCDEVKPDDKQRTCNEHECPATWWIGPWQHCSVTCGPNGLRRRSVFCIRGMTHGEQVVLQDSDCLDHDQEKPDTEVPCEVAIPCNTVNNWVTGEWSQCSATCGEGWHTRAVYCSDTSGSCDMNTKPDITRPCLHEQCDTSPLGNILLTSSDQQSSIVEASLSDTESSMPYSSDTDEARMPMSFGEWEKRVSAKKHDADLPKPTSGYMSVLTDKPNLLLSRSNLSISENERNEQPNKITITISDMTMSSTSDSTPDFMLSSFGSDALRFDPDDFIERDDVFSRSYSSNDLSAVASLTEHAEGVSADPLLAWSHENWHPCSVTCGEGEQQRVVVCINSGTGHITAGCSETNKPDGSRSCRNTECPSQSTCNQDKFSATICQFMVHTGNCDQAHLSDGCCVTCAHLR